MRLLAYLVTLLLMAAAGYAALDLRDVVENPVPKPGDLQRASASAPQSPARESAPTSQGWPALFGKYEPQPPKPPAPPKAEPQPPKPPAPPQPPIASLGYRLKGVVQIGVQNWAIVSHPTGEKILKVGDDLTENVTVDEISSAGLWLQNGPKRELLSFPE